MGKGDRLSIELVGGPPWGFRLGGGADFGCPLEIAKLRKKSKAFGAGLEEGDVVTNIDHQDVSSKSHGDAMKIIEVAGDTLKLNIIKGVGPSAVMLSSAMSESITVNKSDGLPPVNSADIIDQQPVEAMVVRSREPSVARSFTESASRERSVSRSITVIPSAKAQKATPLPAKPAGKSEPWTVNMSYELPSGKSTPHQPPAQPPATEFQALSPPPQKQPPPTSPKPKFKANTLPRASGPAQGGSSCPILPSWAPPPADPALKHHEALLTQPDTSAQSPKPAPMFKVAKVDPKSPAAKWQPTAIQNMDYYDSRNKFNTSTDGMMHSPQLSVASHPSYKSDSNPAAFSPVPSVPPFSQFIPQPPPPPPLNMSPRKPTNHIPGMVNPLICDDSQGDFGANPIIRPNKKMYSDSAFYDAPGMEYPTIQDQVALCKEIATFLESNQNKRSRGGRMFMKRKQKSDEWSMDSQGQRRDLPQTNNYDFYNSIDHSAQQGPTRPMLRKEFGYNTVRHHPDPMKTKLSAAELEQLQHNQEALCKHDALPPNIAFDINEALSHSHGKAGRFFERRRQRAEKFVVDENNVMRQPQSSFAPMQIETPDYGQSRSYVSPWQAAMDGQLEKAFPEQSRPQQSSLQMSQPLSVITNQQQQQPPAQLQVNYRTFKPVTGPGSRVSPAISQQTSQTLPRAKTRLEQMLGASSEPNTSLSSPANSSYSSSYQAPSRQQPSSSMNLPMNSNYQPSPMSSLTIQPGAYNSLHSTPLGQQQPVPATSNFTLNLRRPKHYVTGQTASTSAF